MLRSVSFVLVFASVFALAAFGVTASDTSAAEPEAAALIALNEMVPLGLRKVLPDGYVIEYGEEAARWWRQAAKSIDQGWLMTLDYGFTAGSAILPERVGGTLRGYRRHQVTHDLLSNPGQQDLTAHVHFERLRITGESCGLRTEFFGSQERFLVYAMQELGSAGQEALMQNADRLRQFKTLIHPDHFGHSFQVLVQSRS